MSVDTYRSILTRGIAEVSTPVEVALVVVVIVNSKVLMIAAT